MSTNPPPGYVPPPGGVGSRIEEAVELIEMELRHAIAYVNDAVVPHVRQESISALRTVSDKLRELADRFDRSERSAALMDYSVGVRGFPPSLQSRRRWGTQISWGIRAGMGWARPCELVVRLRA